jgi:hypothetical protein
MSTDESTALVLRHSGEVVDPNDEKQLAKAIQSVQTLKARLAEADRDLRAAFAARAAHLGQRTLQIPGVGRLEVKNASDTTYDVERLEEGLREAGMPEDRIEQMFKTVVTRQAVAAELKRAASANPKYAEVIEACKTVTERTPSVSIT